MKKFGLVVAITGLMALLLTGSALATTFTMTPAQLQALYETYENPGHVGTYLDPVQSITGGAKYVGNVRTSDDPGGWGQIQVGANFWGIPWGGSAGDESTNVALGMDDLTGYSEYGLYIKNVNENAWEFNLYFNMGWTDSGFDEVDYYVQNTWTSMDEDVTKGVIVDFTNAEVWESDWTGGSYQSTTYLGWVDLTDTTTYPNLPWSHVTNIGLNIGGNVPVGPNDYTFEAEVRPIPEPGSLLLLGSGLVGLAGYGKLRLRRKKK